MTCPSRAEGHESWGGFCAHCGAPLTDEARRKDKAIEEKVAREAAARKAAKEAEAARLKRLKETKALARALIKKAEKEKRRGR